MNIVSQFVRQRKWMEETISIVGAIENNPVGIDDLILLYLFLSSSLYKKTDLKGLCKVRNSS